MRKLWPKANAQLGAGLRNRVPDDASEIKYSPGSSLCGSRWCQLRRSRPVVGPGQLNQTHGDPDRVNQGSLKARRGTSGRPPKS
jgi:hypothetical protein